MNAIEKDGGPINPIYNGTKFDGMSLRDWFAGMAIQGLLAAQIHGFNDRPAKGPFVEISYGH